MSDDAPQAGERGGSWQPPSTPPQPPLAAGEPTSADGSPPLTGVAWSLPIATLFLFAIVVVTVGASLLAGTVRSLGLSGPALTLALGALLSVGYAGILAGVWFVARSRQVPFAEAVGIRPASAGAYLGGVALAVVAGRVAAGAWGLALQYFGVNLPGSDIDPTRLFPPGAAGMVTAFVVAVVLAPLTEEILFRGVLLSALKTRWGTGVAIFGSSALFAGMHVSPYAIPPVFVLALVLGWLFVRTRSLTVCIVAHSVFNGVGLAALYALKSVGVM